VGRPLDPVEEELKKVLPPQIHERALEQLLEHARHDDEPRPRLEGHDHYVSSASSVRSQSAKRTASSIRRSTSSDARACRNCGARLRSAATPATSGPPQLSIDKEDDERAGIILYRINRPDPEDFLDLVDALNDEIDELEEGIETWPSAQVRGRISD